MRANRLIRMRGSRNKNEGAEIEMTSLLDILVILLFFLMLSYNASGVVFNIAPDIKLPISESKDINNVGVNVQVSETSIWVDDVVVFDMKDSKGVRLYGGDGQRVIPLFNELVKKKALIKQVQQQAPELQNFSGIVNLIVDKSIKYSFMKKILYTCADAGYAQYKFVVLGEEN